MEKLMDRLNLFDIIAMLTPGVAFILCMRIALCSIDFRIFHVLNRCIPIPILIFGYILGFAFQEVGYWVDKKILHKKYYGGELKEIFLLNSAKEKIFDNGIYYMMGKAIKDDIVNKSKSNDMLKCDEIWNDENETNRYI